MAPCANPPPEEAPVPPGHRRTLNGKAVPVELADQVIPPPRTGRQPPEERAAVPALADLQAVSCACARGEVERLREELEAALERADRLDRVVLNLSEALAARPPVTAHVPPAVPLSPGDMGGHVPLTVPPSQRDETPVVPRGTGAAKGGKGGSATAKPKAELSMTPSAKKKRRHRENQERKKAAAESARAMSPQQHVPLSPGDMSPLVVPPGDTPVRAAKPPAIRKASWKEPTTPSPDKLFFAWCQEQRTTRFPRAVTERPHATWAAWYAEALAAVGGDEERLRGAWLAWLEDDYGHRRDPVCAAIAFTGASEDRGTWRRHIPGQREGAAPAQETPAEARRRASADVGRGDAPPALEVQDTPAGIAWGRVLGAMREAGGAPAYAAGQLQGRFRAVELAGGCLVLEAPDKFALTLLDEDFGGAALNAAVRALGLSLRATVAGQPADAHAGVLQ